DLLGLFRRSTPRDKLLLFSLCFRLCLPGVDKVSIGNFEIQVVEVKKLETWKSCCFHSTSIYKWIY
ncbi:hypothetical protein KZ309_24845, partial [Escherichia coli]|nr:hypothetical protein [Escherichia coli]